MKKTLAKAILILVFALTAFFSWQNRPIQTVKAVEIQPGSPTVSESTGWIGPIRGNRTESEVTIQRDYSAQALIQSTTTQIGADQRPAANDLPSLEEFIPTVYDGQAGGVRGLYIPGLIALRIVQQPDGQFDFISAEGDTATQFQSPALFGVIGLLAHNFLSGSSFFQILPDQMLTIVYGDGRTEDFQVSEIHDYQRLTELDLHSDFQDLNNNQTLSADQVFQQYYQGQRHLTLQTCLERDGNWNWGIRMITAYPVSPAP